jgi:hypothetical protein
LDEEENVSAATGVSSRVGPEQIILDLTARTFGFARFLAD